MEFTIISFILSLFGFGFNAANYVEAHGAVLECGDVSPLSQGADMSAHSTNYEINDVPNNITLQIDGYEIAYPIKTEILGASGQIPTPNSNPPQSPTPLDPPLSGGNFAKGEEGRPRYYILAEPILYRRAGDSEWKSLYDPTSICDDYDFVVLKCKPPKETEK